MLLLFLNENEKKAFNPIRNFNIFFVLLTLTVQDILLKIFQKKVVSDV